MCLRLKNSNLQKSLNFSLIFKAVKWSELVKSCESKIFIINEALVFKTSLIQKLSFWVIVEPLFRQLWQQTKWDVLWKPKTPVGTKKRQKLSLCLKQGNDKVPSRYLSQLNFTDNFHYSEDLWIDDQLVFNQILLMNIIQFEFLFNDLNFCCWFENFKTCIIASSHETMFDLPKLFQQTWWILTSDWVKNNIFKN